MGGVAGGVVEQRIRRQLAASLRTRPVFDRRNQCAAEPAMAPAGYYVPTFEKADRRGSGAVNIVAPQLGFGESDRFAILRERQQHVGSLRRLQRLTQRIG